MKIGSGWTKTNETDGSTFISFSLDKVILELFPQMENCNLIANFINEVDRKQENSPGWSLSISKKNEQNKKTSTKEAEKEITESAKKETTADGLIAEEEIPY